MLFPVGDGSNGFADGDLARRRRSRHRPLIGITTTRARLDGDPHHAATVAEPYVEAVLAAGGLPVVLPVLAPSLAAETLAELDGLLLTGGGDVDPARYGDAVVRPEVYGVDGDRDAWELELARTAPVPVLGICRGAQVLNVAAGGTLVQHLEGHRERDRSREIVHDVAVAAGSVLHGVVGGRVGVNTLHHQAVAEPGTGLRVVATAPDGTVEAIESAHGAPVLGVQWHPELLADRAAHAALFAWLVDAAVAGVAPAVA